MPKVMYLVAIIDWYSRKIVAWRLSNSYIGGLDSQGKPADTRTPLQQLAIKQLIGLLVNEFKIYDVYGHRDLFLDVNGDGEITSVDWVKMCPCYDAHAEWLAYLREMAIVSRNYVHAQTSGGEPMTPELQKLCAAGASAACDADSDYNPERDDNTTFSAVINPNDANPVPPMPNELSEPKYKLSLGGWREMNWRDWGVLSNSIPDHIFFKYGKQFWHGF